jgi:hypothetical protein
MRTYLLMIALSVAISGLISCTNFADMTPAELAEYNASPINLEECWYDKEGVTTNPPCRGIVVLIDGAYYPQTTLMPRRNVDDYDITWVGYHTVSEATQACLSWTGKHTRACGTVDHENKTARFLTVYGDKVAMNHELTHITNDDIH